VSDAGPTVPRFTPEFVERFRGVLHDVFGWPERDGGVEVRNWRGQRVLSMLPHLSYVDLDVTAARAVADGLDGRRYLIRVLGEPGDEAIVGAPVTMRIPLQGRSDATLRSTFDHDRMTRKNLNRARRMGLSADRSATPEAVDEFVSGLARTLHRLGAPMIPPRLVETLLARLDSDLVLIAEDSRAVAGLVLLHDRDVSWIPWSYNRVPDPVRGAGDLAFVEAAALARDRGSMVLDLGRSPLGSGAFEYKSRFGAVPVPILMLRSGVPDPYGYSGGPQRAWSRLPRAVADVVGPRLCRVLPEY
jgi:hypothetical protein